MTARSDTHVHRLPVERISDTTKPREVINMNPELFARAEADYRVESFLRAAASYRLARASSTRTLRYKLRLRAARPMGADSRR